LLSRFVASSLTGSASCDHCFLCIFLGEALFETIAAISFVGVGRHFQLRHFFKAMSAGMSNDGLLLEVPFQARMMEETDGGKLEQD
jgi:hypothetical protein